MEHDLRPPGSPAESTGPHESLANAYRLIWWLFGFVMALALLVLIILPVLVAQREHPQEAEMPAAEIAAAPPLPVGVARHDAEQALQAFLRLRAEPVLANADSWAASAWQGAMEKAVQGDQFYGRGQFDAALDAYRKAAAELQAILEDKPRKLRDTMSKAWSFLDQNAAEQAVVLFEQARAMDDSEEARLGLARAQVRMQVLSLMDEARQAETAGDLQAAGNAFSQAIALDPHYGEAGEGRQRINIKQGQLAFDNAMSRALVDLDQGRLSDARASIKEASAMHPEHPAVKDAQRRLQQLQRNRRLRQLHDLAAASTAIEDWKAAAVHYRNALAIDEKAAFASSGLHRAEQRIRLHQQIDHYLSSPLRLSSAEPLANARRLLDSNQAVPEAEPLLASKIASLDEAVRLVVVPVPLEIRSDGMTDISIYHVGRLGKLTSRTLKLRPGRYTVTGARAGYRDVRKIILLQPGSAGEIVNLFCKEPV